MAKRVSARRIKIHRQYTYESAADALGVTVQTVRGWRKEGLAVLNSQKPHLILGHDLKDFLDKRNPKTPGKLAPDHFFCMSCHASREAYGAMADYVPIDERRGRLVVLCAVCQTVCGKFVSSKMREQLTSLLTIATRDRD